MSVVLSLYWRRFACKIAIGGWPGSCSRRRCGRPVLKFLAASLAFVLAAAPNAAVLCRTWCDARPVEASCHHRAPSSPTTVAARHDCADEGIAAIPGITERSKRAAALDVRTSMPEMFDPSHATAVAAARVVPVPALAALPPPPLIAVLRI